MENKIENRDNKSSFFIYIKKSILTFMLTVTFFNLSHAQSLRTIELNFGNGIEVKSFNGFLHTDYKLPLVSFKVDSVLYNTLHWPVVNETVTVDNKLSIGYEKIDYLDGMLKGKIRFTNISNDTLKLHNVVPLGESEKHVYITGKGNHGLSRTHLFRPGYAPVNVIVPDNAWELGFSTINVDNGNSVCALVRRQPDLKNAERRRFETILYPGGSVTYNIWFDDYIGQWQEGLRKIFQEYKLFDVDPGTFDYTFNNREDQQWIKHSYVGHFVHAWYDYFYDQTRNKYSFLDFHSWTQKLYGGDDYSIIWYGFPVLGLDQRNQFDLLRVLPGGIEGFEKVVQTVGKDGGKILVGYNPWDLPAAENPLFNSTRLEDHFAGLQEITSQTGISGIMLDTRSENYLPLQIAMDSTADGFVVFPEGMSVPKQMQYTVVGRVHGALSHPPMLNLVKFILPDYAIFRQVIIEEQPVYREFAVSFFNGYGVEIHSNIPQQTKWLEDMYEYLGRTTRILKENTNAFTKGIYTPLLPTATDNVWVNEWRGQQKTIYTIYSELPKGFNGVLCEVFPEEGYHFVDLWNHKPAVTRRLGGKFLIDITLEGYDQGLAGTDNEGVNGCFARLPEMLDVKLNSAEYELEISAKEGTKILLWKNNPSYSKTPYELPIGDNTISLDQFEDYENSKWVIQLFDQNNLLLDEVIVLSPNYEPDSPSRRNLENIDASKSLTKPVLLSESINSIDAGDTKGMVLVPSGTLHFKAEHIGDWFIPHPLEDIDKDFIMSSYYIDKYPVTNIEFKKFLDESGYTPVDNENFLAHWEKGEIPVGQENFPVVYVNIDDARAYAKWAGKRLPTEKEWQYAAQAGDDRLWPWGNERELGNRRCNPGNGIMEPVGKYPLGANPLGIEDLVGSVWQMTNDVYKAGTITYGILKGGSYFTTKSSWWYVQGGPLPLINRQQYIFVSPGYERNATVGFRCVMDIK